MENKQKPDPKVTLSIVVPVFNESPNLDYLCDRLVEVLSKLNITYEIILINDGSSDDTLQKALKCKSVYPQIVIIDLARNFGKEIALTAGLDYSRGEAVIPIDADLQDPPELIEKLLAKWYEGYDVVCATRKKRLGESWFKRLTASGFYKTISKLSTVSIPENTGDFRLLDRKVVDAIKLLPERTRFMKGLFAWVGYRQTTIYFERKPRFAGQTKWNYWKLWNFALDGITGFSSIPLKVWSYLGIFIALLSIIYAAYLTLRTIIFGVDIPGYASLMVSILFLGSVQLIAIGVLGEYMSRIYEETKQRPLYLVREIYDLDYANSSLQSTTINRY